MRRWLKLIAPLGALALVAVLLALSARSPLFG